MEKDTDSLAKIKEQARAGALKLFPGQTEPLFQISSGQPGKQCDFYPHGSVHRNLDKIHNFCEVRLVPELETKACPHCKLNFPADWPFVINNQMGGQDMCVRCYGKHWIVNNGGYFEAVRAEILHSNVGKGEIKKVSVFDGVKSSAVSRHKRNEFDGVEEVGIEKFMADILPSCTSVEVFLKNNHENNMVSLTTANDPNSKPIFKWPNNYSWTYNGNLAGKSQLKQAVKDLGGKVDGVLRFTISWNEDGKSIVDFDAHAMEPNKTEIAYDKNYRKDRGNLRTSMSGQLDIDMISPREMGIENIAWSDISKMKDGVYTFWIRNFNGGQNTGFKAEIEFNGETYSYEHTQPVRGDVMIADVWLEKGEFTIQHRIPESAVSSREIYGLETNQFQKVNLVCLSPNHWGESAIGNKHYFFMLDNCLSPVSIRSFHNENLNAELAEHRKVMEVLGTTNMIDLAGKQLSGLGFNATVRDELIVRLGGNFKRTIKIKF